MQRTSDAWLWFLSVPTSKYVSLLPNYLWEQVKISRVVPSGNVGVVTFLRAKEVCVTYALLCYLLILVASCQTYFVTALIHYVVASKKIPYFSNSTCMHSRKQSKIHSELREEEKDPEQGAILSPNREPGSKDELRMLLYFISPIVMCSTIVFCSCPEMILTIFFQACLLLFP